MTFLNFIRLIIKNWKLLSISPIVIGVLIFLLKKNDEEKYASQTTVYTGFASGYSVENGESAKQDFNSINTAFDNIINIIKSRETKEQVALLLLAKHINLLGKENKSISKNHLIKINEKITKSLINELKSDTDEETFQKLVSIKNRNEQNDIYKLLNNPLEPYYSVFAINKISVSRVQASDIIQLNFETDDPGVCQDVLAICTKVFIRNYKKIKSGETSNVADFFEKQTQIAYQKLNEAEERLKIFRTDNKIINYDEQTKFISEKHENIIDERNKEKMELVAAEAVVENINNRLGSSQKALKANNDLLELRNELSQINAKLLTLKIDDNSANSQSYKSLYTNSISIKKKIEDKVNEIFSTSVSKEGVSNKDLAKSWIENNLKLDESKAKLSIYGERMQEIEKNYDLFAPLGSNISKMEREIAICEKEYLSNLSSLNASKLREKNLLLNANLQVVDEAFYPIEPLPNKKMLLIVAGSLSSFFVLLIIIVVTDLLDQNIKTVSKAKSLVTFDIISGYPKMLRSTSFLYENGSLTRLLNITISKIHQIFRLKENEKTPFIIAVLSSKKSDGKSFIMNELANKLIQNHKKVLIIYAAQNEFNFNEKIDKESFEINYEFDELENIHSICSDNSSKKYDFIFIEFPAFQEHKSPVGLLNSCDLNLFILNAKRVWNEADQSEFSSFDEINKQKTFGFLNNMDVYQLESFIGEIPFKRSFIRKLVKKWIQFDFNSNS